MERLDALVFAAHPDDAEISMGGTIVKLIKESFSVGIIDFSRGELGSRGSKEIRDEESRKASEVLKISLRENLNLPDGALEVNKISVGKTVEIIRKYRPKIIFAPYFNDRHPDHIAASKIVKSAFFFSGVVKYPLENFNNQEVKYYRPKKLFYYMSAYEFEPSFIVDITNEFETKLKAIEAYESQFFSKGNNAPETLIASENFRELISARAKNYGFRIRKKYGEPFFMEEGLEFDFKIYLG